MNHGVAITRQSGQMKKRSKLDRTSQVDQDELRYRTLVESTHPSLSSPTPTLEAIYLHFGLAYTNSLTRHHVAQHLYSQIASTLHYVPMGRKRGLRLQSLKHQLLLRHFADNEALQPYLAFLEVIMDATRPNDWVTPPLTDLNHWRVALTAAADYDLLNSSTFRDPQMLIARTNPRQYSVATAVKRLRTFGCRIGIVHGKVIIPHTEEARIAERIESRIHAAGGLEIANSIFHSIRHKYEPTQERYHIVRSTGTAGRTSGPSVPIAYLLNLCVKDAGVPPSEPKRFGAAMKDAVDVATAYAAIFDLEPYNTFETLFNSGSRLPHFLQELAVYDGMFNLVQGCPSVVDEVLRSLFDWYDDVVAARALGWTIGQGALVARTILKLARDVRGPFGFTRADLAARLSILPPASLAQILNVFAHKLGTANSKYHFPYEQTKVDFGFKPLIELAPDRFILMDRSWCAPAFYEAILGAVRQMEPNADVQVGRSLERLIKAELRKHSIHVASGRYSIGDQHGECDAVVETSDRIIIIEIKKKSLTRQSRSGHCVNLFCDLAESLLAAQCQIGRHELLLYKHGALDLVDDTGGPVQRVERRDRAVERVALSLLDFGAMQDRRVLSQILETTTAYRIGTYSVKDEAQIARVQKMGDTLAGQYKELATLRAEPKGAAFMNCSFMSLGQLLVVLQGVTSNDAFQKSLFNTRFITMGSLDFYYEHAQVLAMRAHGAN